MIERALGAGHVVDDVAAASSDRPVVRRPDRADVRAAPRRSRGGHLPPLGAVDLREAKRGGLSDARSRSAHGRERAAVRRHREALGVRPVFKTVDTCAGEFPARTPYHFSTYEDETEVRPATASRRHPRRRAEPDRAGDRVRLRLRARCVRPRGGRVRVGDDELEPRDRLDRLRHLQPALLRAPRPPRTSSPSAGRNDPSGSSHSSAVRPL